MPAPAKVKWLEFWRRLGGNGNPAPWFAGLEVRYSERHRAYHNLTHVMNCLAEFELASHLTQDPVAAEMALWYHDVVYDPRAKDNEERSAAIAVQLGDEIGLPRTFKTRVKRLILATKRHDGSMDRDAPLVVDIDLSILGQTPQRFDAYERQIRQEYDWVSEERFAAGRTAVLKSFLARPAIFATDLFRSRYEQQARDNLKRSISKLNSQTS